MTKRNRELGRDGEITRRDFLDGVALAIGGTVASTVVGSARADAETVVPGAASPPPAPQSRARDGLRSGTLAAFGPDHSG